MSVCVLERREIVGGAAVTEAFYPGFRNSTASYTVSLLAPQVIEDLHLADHGLRIVKRPLANFLPLSGTAYLKVGGGIAACSSFMSKSSEKRRIRSKPLDNDVPPLNQIPKPSLVSAHSACVTQ